MKKISENETLDLIKSSIESNNIEDAWQYVFQLGKLINDK